MNEKHRTDDQPMVCCACKKELKPGNAWAPNRNELKGVISRLRIAAKAAEGDIAEDLREQIKALEKLVYPKDGESVSLFCSGHGQQLREATGSPKATIPWEVLKKILDAKEDRERDIQGALNQARRLRIGGHADDALSHMETFAAELVENGGREDPRVGREIESLRRYIEQGPARAKKLFARIRESQQRPQRGAPKATRVADGRLKRRK